MSWWLYAQAAPAGAPGGGGDPVSFLVQFAPIILLFGVMYVLLFLPQQRKEKQKREMLAALAKGDEVITIGGIHGTVVNLGEHDVVLRVDDKTTIKFLRSSIAQVTSASADDAAGEGKKKK